eukprot:13180521-Alexandrium_andersonii.AAC.1
MYTPMLVNPSVLGDMGFGSFGEAALQAYIPSARPMGMSIVPSGSVQQLLECGERAQPDFQQGPRSRCV